MGFLRLLLALCVVAAHTAFSFFPVSGREAVLLFYIISGFYMSLILNEKYVGPGATLAFYKSRFLRLWVPYSVVMLVVLVGFGAVGKLSSYAGAYADFPWPYAVFAAFSNMAIVGQDLLWLFSSEAGELVFRPMGEEGFNGAALSLNTPVFSVSFELCFYALAPFFLKSKGRTYLFAFLGLAYHLALVRWFHRQDLWLFYHVFPSTMLYFGLGGVAYHLSRSQTARTETLAAYFLLVLLFFVKPMVAAPYLVMFTVLLPVAFSVTRKAAVDRWLGELSYGVYIFHVPLIAFLNALRPGELWGRSFWGVFLASLLFSIALHHWVEAPLSRYRESRIAGALACRGQGNPS